MRESSKKRGGCEEEEEEEEEREREGPRQDEGDDLMCCVLIEYQTYFSSVCLVNFQDEKGGVYLCVCVSGIEKEGKN